MNVKVRSIFCNFTRLPTENNSKFFYLLMCIFIYSVYFLFFYLLVCIFIYSVYFLFFYLLVYVILPDRHTINCTLLQSFTLCGWIRWYKSIVDNLWISTLGVILDLNFVPSPCEKVVIVPDTNFITSAIRKFMMDIPSRSSFRYISL